MTKKLLLFVTILNINKRGGFFMQRSVAVVKNKTVKPNVIKLISGYIDFTTAAFAVMGFYLVGLL